MAMVYCSACQSAMGARFATGCQSCHRVPVLPSGASLAIGCQSCRRVPVLPPGASLAKSGYPPCTRDTLAPNITSNGNTIQVLFPLADRELLESTDHRIHLDHRCIEVFLDRKSKRLNSS